MTGDSSGDRAGEEAGGQQPLVVPDDARDLGRDVEALRRERRASDRRSRAGRLLVTGRYRRVGLSTPLIIAILVVVAGFGALMTVLRPSFPEPAGPQPLASPAVAPGGVGGLLPDGPVTTPAGPTTTRALPRPGVLVLVPVPCGCDPLLGGVVDQVLQVTRDVRLLSTGAQDPGGQAVRALRDGASRGLVTAGVDERGVLASAYGARGVTVVLVAPDGVVVDVVVDVRPGQRLDAQVGRLQSRTR